VSRERRLAAALALLGTIIALGTASYVVFENATLGDALYMTVITITTVGYNEVIPLDGTGRLLTGILIVVGVGSALYTAGIALEIGLERIVGGDWRRRRMSKEIAGIRDHVIVCGFGRVGRNTWKELKAEDTEAVVIERDPELVASAEAMGALVVAGDATKDDALAAAGIDRARALIACVQLDADNLVIVLSAKNRNPSLRVVARAVEADAEEKLRLAGADRVVLPQKVGAQRLAALAGRPHLDEFVDLVLHGKLVELRIEEFTVGGGSPLVGATLRSSDIRGRSGALVLALEDLSGRLVFNPDPGMTFRPSQAFICMGTESQLERLRSLTSAG
jgi:voltage-gated potassium channel